MNKQQAKAKIKELSQRIEEHNHKYYVLDQPVVSDREYDDLLKELIDLERTFPDLLEANSPSQRVGTKIASSAATIKHRTKMYSLDNSYNIEELLKWHERVVKGLGREDVDYVAEYKIDGVSMSLTYHNGELHQAATRGDGIEGEDVTHSIKTIRSLPLKLKPSKGEKFPAYLEVRGEVFMASKDFEQLNKERKRNKEELFANPRNATSGSIKLLDSRITAQRHLRMVVHSFGTMEGRRPFVKHSEFLKQCTLWGLPVSRDTQICSNIGEVIQYCETASRKRDSLDYEVDGVVIKVDGINQQSELGATLKSPRWAVAYKFAAYQATTKVEDILIQVGRTGVLTPVAQLKPVSCGGVTISRATLHNFDEIRRLNVHVGDRVLIERAGDVIPKIIKVVEFSGKKVRAISAPKRCPQCQSPIVKDVEGLVAYRCENPSCLKQLERRLIHFASRQAMDIEGLGEQAVDQLLASGLVKDLADVYFLKKDDFLKLELFADKKAENLVSAVQESKKRPLSRFIFGFGIMHVGEKISATLAKRYGSLEALTKAKEEGLLEVPEVGPAIAQSVVATFKLDATKKLIEKFRKAGVNMAEPKTQLRSSKLQDKRFVFTGELSNMSRSQAGEIVKSLGADVVSSVSKQTDFVVAGSAPGSKLEKAKALGVTILNEKQFKELIDA